MCINELPLRDTCALMNYRFVVRYFLHFESYGLNDFGNVAV